MRIKRLNSQILHEFSHELWRIVRITRIFLNNKLNEFSF